MSLYWWKFSFREATWPVSVCTSLIVRGEDIAAMVCIFSGFPSMARCVSMNPKNFPKVTPKADFWGFSFIRYCLRTWREKKHTKRIAKGFPVALWRTIDHGQCYLKGLVEIIKVALPIFFFLNFKYIFKILSTTLVKLPCDSCMYCHVSYSAK